MKRTRKIITTILVTISLLFSTWVGLSLLDLGSVSSNPGVEGHEWNFFYVITKDFMD